MQWAILIGLVILMVLWAMIDIAGSVATAKQAQATIETAKVAQVASVGNLVVILVTALVVVLLIAVAALALWAYYRLKFQPAMQQHRTPGHISPGSQPPAVDMGAALNTLVQLKILEALGSQNAQSNDLAPYVLAAPEEEPNEFLWR